MNPPDFINCCPLYVPPHWSFICLRQAFSSFLDPSAREQLTNTLDQEVSRLRQLTFAESARRTYSCQLLLYLQFCSSLNISPVPISQHDLGHYVAFISSILSFSSVRQYLNVIRLLHLEGGYANPLLENWYISSILKGIQRLKGDASRQKLPITCQILQRPFDLCFWAACLVGFFSFFHKSNLFVPSVDQFDPCKHICRTDVEFGPSWAVLSVRWSKTIQFQQCILHIPLPRIVHSPFCPTGALLLCLSRLPNTSCPSPLFCYPTSRGPKPMTHIVFQNYLRGCLQKLGIDPSLYSGHSLRRGGASFALQCGLSAELIKLQGDWSSNAYQRYLNPSLAMRQQLATTLGKSFPHFWAIFWFFPFLTRGTDCPLQLCVGVSHVHVCIYLLAANLNYTYLGLGFGDLYIISATWQIYTMNISNYAYIWHFNMFLVL